MGNCRNPITRTYEQLGGLFPLTVIWFIELLDCLKSISDKTILELMNRSTHDLHPIDWGKTNAKPPEGYDQLEYWRFRLNKSRGRVIGTIIDNVFYVMWLDPYHNLTDREGYGGVH